MICLFYDHLVKMCNTRGKDVHLCKRMCTTTCKFAEPPIFLSLNQPRSPGWLIFQTCFLADHPKKMWHLCYTNYLQHSWSITLWKCDICAGKMICDKHICRFWWFSNNLDLVSWPIAPLKCDICATQMIWNKHICRFCWFSITPITVDPFSVQSVRDYTKAWLTADRPSSSPRTSITVFPCLPTKTPLLTHTDATVFHRQKFYDTSFVF